MRQVMVLNHLWEKYKLQNVNKTLIFRYLTE